MSTEKKVTAADNEKLAYEKYKAMGVFTEEEIQNLLEADAIVETLKLLPDDIEAFGDKVEKEFDCEPDEALQKFVKLTESDPEYAKQILAYTSLIDPLDAGENDPKVGGLSADEIKKAKLENMVEEVTKKTGKK